MRYVAVLVAVSAFACTQGDAPMTRSSDSNPSTDRPAASSTISDSEVPPTTSTVASTTPSPTMKRADESGGVAQAPAQRRNVTITAPRQGVAVTSNPVTISGTARTFENSVAIRLRNANGRVLLETHTTAEGEMGTFSAWNTSVFLTAHPGRTLQVEAFEISARDGSEESLVKVTTPYQVQSTTYQLFFHDPKRAPTDCSKVFAHAEQMPASKSALRLLVEALLRGPSPAAAAKGAAASFPQGSEVRSVTIRDGAAIVDFNERLQNVGGACRAQAIRASLEQTLTRLPGVKRVIVRANGNEQAAVQP